jgi:hypothetical protein
MPAHSTRAGLLSVCSCLAHLFSLPIGRPPLLAELRVGVGGGLRVSGLSVRLCATQESTRPIRVTAERNRTLLRRSVRMIRVQEHLAEQFVRWRPGV